MGFLAVQIAVPVVAAHEAAAGSIRLADVRGRGGGRGVLRGRPGRLGDIARARGLRGPEAGRSPTCSASCRPPSARAPAPSRCATAAWRRPSRSRSRVATDHRARGRRPGGHGEGAGVLAGPGPARRGSASGADAAGAMAAAIGGGGALGGGRVGGAGPDRCRRQGRAGDRHAAGRPRRLRADARSADGTRTTCTCCRCSPSCSRSRTPDGIASRRWPCCAGSWWWSMALPPPRRSTGTSCPDA